MHNTNSPSPSLIINNHTHSWPPLELPFPSAPNAPSKTPSTKDTSSSSIDYIPKSPTSSTSLSPNGYLNLPTSPPPRVSLPPLTYENASMDITLTLSPITPLDVQFDTPSPLPPIVGHPIPWNLLEAHGDSCLCRIHNHLEAFSDSYYAGASLDRKSTTGGCQFLGKRLISWQCKKQTIVANSTTEAEYVAAANSCRQVIKIHTDHNVADLLTKDFDVSSMDNTHKSFVLMEGIWNYVDKYKDYNIWLLRIECRAAK
ncbi:hypothetical protein Tco_1338928 [Tanacetum coccineum]